MMRILLFLLLAVTAISAGAKISVNVPPSLPNYELLDRLEAMHCASPTFRVFKPQSHLELRSGLLMEKGQPCEAPEWLLKERELLLRPILQNDARASLVATQNDTIPLVGVDASVTPLFSLREGRPTYSGPNLYFELVANADVGKDWGVALSATPGFLIAFNNYNSLLGRFYFQEGYAKFGYKRAEITFGRTALSFGDAKHGTLALSASAAPLDLLKFAIRPHVLGSPFDFLGAITFETWLSNQGDSAFISGANLWGIELGVRPTNGFEFGLLEIYQFGGVGQPPLQASDYLSMLVYAGSSELDSKRHRSFGAHFNFWLPSNYAKLYTQFFFENLTTFSNLFPNDMSVLAGIWFPNLGITEVRLEYVHTVPGAYRSAQWPQGFSFKGTPLGHPLGPDGEGVYFDIGLPQFEDLRPVLNLRYEARGKHIAAPLATEWRYGFGLEMKTRLIATEFEVQTQFDFINNHAYVSGANSYSLGVLAMMRYSFL